MGSPKGGVGKTTIAVTLASIGHRSGLSVLLVDGDANRSAMDWAESAGDRLPIDVADGQDPTVLSRLRRAGEYDLVVVDLPGAHRGAFHAVLTGDGSTPVPDLLVTPSPPETMDLRPTLRVLRGEVATLGLPYLLTFARVPHWAMPRARQQLDVLDAAGVSMARTIVRGYTAYNDALEQGMTVLDLPPSRSAGNAVEDNQALATEVFAAAGIDTSVKVA